MTARMNPEVSGGAHKRAVIMEFMTLQHAVTLSPDGVVHGPPAPVTRPGCTDGRQTRVYTTYRARTRYK